MALVTGLRPSDERFRRRRIQEGVVPRFYAEIFFRNVRASVVPQSSSWGRVQAVSVLAGHHDFVIMVDDGGSHVHHRPRGHQDGLNEVVSFEDLGGAPPGSKSGVSHLRLVTTNTPFRWLETSGCCRPTSVPMENPGQQDRSCDALDSIIPDDPAKPYDVLDVIAEVLDDGGFGSSSRLGTEHPWGWSPLGGHGRRCCQPTESHGCSTSMPATKPPVSFDSAARQHPHPDIEDSVSFPGEPGMGSIIRPAPNSSTLSPKPPFPN